MAEQIIVEAAPSASSAESTEQIAEFVQAVVHVFGYDLNLSGSMIMLVLAGLLYLFYRIQRLEKLDFADLITKDGRSVSLTKVLQLIGGITATWIMIKLTLSGTLTEALFGLYLTYVGAIEGYSKYVSAKYKYSETSVKDAVGKE